MYVTCKLGEKFFIKKSELLAKNAVDVKDEKIRVSKVFEEVVIPSLKVEYGKNLKTFYIADASDCV